MSQFAQKTTMNSSLPKQSLVRKGLAVERWEKELLRAFDDQIKGKLVVEDQDFIIFNPNNLTSELKSTEKIALRTAQQAADNGTVTLKRFDPNFMSPKEIRCRSPGCKQKRKRQSPSSKTSKEDLYLCPTHRKLVEDYVSKICAEKGLDVSTTYSPQDFEGYTSMIGLLESACVLFMKRPPGSESVLKGKPAILREVFLNLRNFLMITNALLNPDVGNLLTALNRAMEIFMEILREDDDKLIARLTQLVGLLRLVIDHILFAFGVIYSWVYIALTSNPGAQVGAGMGGIAGMIGLLGGPLVGLLAMAGGSLFGGLTGSGIYNLQKQRRERQAVEEGLRRYQEYVQTHRVQEDVHNEPAASAENNLQGLAEPDDSGVYYITGSEIGDLGLAFIFFLGQCFSPVCLGI